METITTAEIRAHLHRLLKRPSFTDSMVLSNFLSFIVNETLDGRSHELKEYTIAVNALKKDIDFNPQIDSIVRIHAGRLRRALKEYYFEDGAQEDIKIVVPKGSYVPTFIRNVPADLLGSRGDDELNSVLRVSKTFHVADKTSLAVFPFDDISESKGHDSFITGLKMYLATSLTSNERVRLVSYMSSDRVYKRLTDIKEAGALLDAAFIVTGCVQFDKHFRAHIVLNACDTGAQLWGTTIEKKDVEQIDLFALQKEIAQSVTMPLCSAILEHGLHIVHVGETAPAMEEIGGGQISEARTHHR